VAYITLAELRTYLGAHASDDALLNDTIAAATDWIDRYCGHSFELTAATARYFTAGAADFVETDPFVTVTSLRYDIDDDGVYEATVPATAYSVSPSTAPYTQVWIRNGDGYGLPGERRRVELTATYGWPTVPGAVKYAAKLQTARLWKRKDAPFGLISGSMGEMERIAGLDPDVKHLLEPFVLSAKRFVLA